MQTTDEIKEWQTHSAKVTVAAILMLDGISFSFTDEDGIVFTAPDCYVERLKDRAVCAYGCRRYPQITEFKPAE